MRENGMIRMLTLLIGALLGTIILLALSPLPARAQNQLTISSATATIPVPGVAEYDAGFSNSVAFTATMDPTTGGTGFNRIMSVRIRCQAVTNGKPCSDVQWNSPPDVAAFTDLTGTFATVRTRCIRRTSAAPPGCPVGIAAAADPHAFTINLRMRLAWAVDAPNAYAATIRVTLDVYRQ